MNRLIEPPRYGKNISDFGYRSASLPKFGGGDRNRLRGIPSYGYGSPSLSYKVGSGSTRPGALPPTLAALAGASGGTPASSSGGVSFGGMPGNPNDYAIGQETYDVGGAAKTPSSGAMLGDALKLAAVGTGIGTGLNAIGAPTFGLPVVKDIGNIGSGISGFFKNLGGGAPEPSGITSLFDKVNFDKFKTVGSDLKNIFTNPKSLLQDSAFDFNLDKFRTVGSDIKGGFENFKDFISGEQAKQTPPGFFDKVGNFFNTPREFITGADGVGMFGNPGELGSGISSIGNVLGTVGGLFSLNEFMKDPSVASGLGTLAGAGASGIPLFAGTAAAPSKLAVAAPWLAGAALVASLLMNKKPSNKTGYTSIDLDEFKPLSFGMEGGKYSQENVDQTAQIMEPLIPAIQQLEKQYGVDLKGDIQVNYGGRDGLAYNIGNRDVTGFRNRLDYFDGRDQSTRDGGNIYRRTFKGKNAGKDFYTSLLTDLETLAKQKQASGGGIIDLANYSGVRRTPQNISPEQLRALAANVRF
jgi:hypothetical protein